MVSENDSMDVIVQVGAAVERIERLPPGPGEPEETVTLIFSFGNSAALSMIFGAAAFLSFSRRVVRVAEALPGPS